MGYYTYFWLDPPRPTKNCALSDKEIAKRLVTGLLATEYWEGNECLKAELEALDKLPDADVLARVTDDLNYGGMLSDSIKWYDHEDHMSDISAAIPDVYFILNGDGEDSDDLWRKYFFNGRIYAYYSMIPDQEMSRKVSEEARKDGVYSGEDF